MRILKNQQVDHHGVKAVQEAVMVSTDGLLKESFKRVYFNQLHSGVKGFTV